MDVDLPNSHWNSWRARDLATLDAIYLRLDRKIASFGYTMKPTKSYAVLAAATLSLLLVTAASSADVEPDSVQIRHYLTSDQ